MKTSYTSIELKHLIQQRLDALCESTDDGDEIFARDVHGHALDDDGRNWDMRGFRGPASYAMEVRLVVDRLRREYLLQEPVVR